MSDFVSKEYLVESFDAIVSEMKDTSNKMTSNQCFLNVFENKDISGTDMSDFKMASTYETMIMYLYIKKLSAKNEEDWDFPKFPETVYTEMYEKIVEVRHPSDFLGKGEDVRDSECPEKNVSEVDCDEEMAQNVKGMDEKYCQAKFFGFFKSFLFYFYVCFQFFFNNAVQVDECGLNSAECGNVVKREDFECPEYTCPPSQSIDWSLLKPTPCPVMEYSGIAMCEFTLIQSMDDLEASHTLLTNSHFSQSVFMSSQSVEKSLKSILSSYKMFFPTFKNLHCAKKLFRQLEECRKNKAHNPYSMYSDRFETLCHHFESIGADSWTFPKPLSIRCRYFNYQSSTFDLSSRHHYYVDSYPGLVYTRDLATEAYEIAEEIFKLSEIIIEELVNKFETEFVNKFETEL